MFASWLNRLVRRFRPQHCPECGHVVHETFCDVCGYDLVRRTQDKTFHRTIG